MNEFQPIIFLARSGNHRVLSENPYYSSEAFAQRSDLVGNEDPADKVSILLYMLKHIAVHPDEAAAVQSNLKQGLVHVRFFAFSSPVTVFWLNKDVPQQQALLEQLKTALAENLQTRLFKAAERTLHWRSPKMAHRRDSWQRRVETELRKQFAWPEPSEYRKDYAAAELREIAMRAAFEERANRCRQRRNARLAALEALSHRNVGSYYELLEKLALEVLTPPPDFKAEQQELTAQEA